MRSLRVHIAVSLVFLLLPSTEAGIIKNAFTSLFGGKEASKSEGREEKPETERTTPGQGGNVWNANDDFRSPGSKPNAEYGAAGTYTKKPIVVDGTTEKYKNTSWYIENEDYLSPNENESKQQQKPNREYGGGGTYTVRPVSSTTKKWSGGGNFVSSSENQQHRPTGFTNNNRRQDDLDDGHARGKETTRTSIQRDDSNRVVLEADGVTCCYSNVKEKIEERSLRCNEMECRLDKVYEKSSLWVCDVMKCTVANVDFSQEHGNKKLLECSDGRNIITVQNKPLNCGPDEKEHNGRCRKVFGATKPSVVCGL